MFTRSYELFRLFGFSVKVDPSWLVIAALVTWSLAAPGGLFPHRFPGLTAGVYWTMGAFGALGLFASIVLHELSHSLVARLFDIRMQGITLFIFGGVAEMEDEPPGPRAEFWMAIVGPVASVLIGAACFGLYLLGSRQNWPMPLNGVLWYLGVINGILAAFNMVPAFPLDGGRVLRSALWAARGSLRWATKITAALGSAFGLFLILVGILAVFGGNFLGGMWYFLIGMFLRGAANMSYQQVLVRRALEGEPVQRFMVSEVVTVPPEISLERLVDDYVYRYHHKLFPVAEEGGLRGCVTTREIKLVPREEWRSTTVRDVMAPCTDDNTIHPDADAIQAFARMNRTDASRLIVAENGRLRGIISLKDLMRFLSLKIELEE
ncbi:MAG: site-2 protease family protein [Planctomycetales bacterium]